MMRGAGSVLSWNELRLATGATNLEEAFLELVLASERAAGSGRPAALTDTTTRGA